MFPCKLCDIGPGRSSKGCDMVAKKGKGLLMVYADVRPEDEDEFNRWYNEEHLHTRIG